MSDVEAPILEGKRVVLTCCALRLQPDTARNLGLTVAGLSPCAMEQFRLFADLVC